MTVFRESPPGPMHRRQVTELLRQRGYFRGRDRAKAEDLVEAVLAGDSFIFISLGTGLYELRPGFRTDPSTAP